MRALHLPPPALEDPVGQLMKNAGLKGQAQIQLVFLKPDGIPVLVEEASDDP